MSDTAVLVVDMMNDYRHPDADLLARDAARIIEPLADLIGRTHRSDDVDLVYVNDNYGDFTADFSDLVDAALDGAHPDLVRPIAPAPDSLTVTKVRHSVFYATALGYLLERRRVQRLVLAGQVTEQCILYSALDAYVRHIPVTVAADAVAHIDADLAEAALRMMRQNMGARLTTAAECLDHR